MSLIYNPTYYPFTILNTCSAAQLSALFYDDVNPDKALSVVNGLIDNTFLDASLVITPDYVQRKAQVDAAIAAGTSNLDYTKWWFYDYDSSTAFDGTAVDQARPIPGGQVHIELTETALVRFSWTAMWTSDSSNIQDKTRIFFGYTGGDELPTVPEAMVRQCSNAMNSGSHEGYLRNRVYSGHCYRLLAAGSYDAGLYIVGDKDVSQSRVWSRSAKAVILYGEVPLG